MYRLHNKQYKRSENTDVFLRPPPPRIIQKKTPLSLSCPHDLPFPRKKKKDQHSFITHLMLQVTEEPTHLICSTEPRYLLERGSPCLTPLFPSALRPDRIQNHDGIYLARDNFQSAFTPVLLLLLLSQGPHHGLDPAQGFTVRQTQVQRQTRMTPIFN